MNLPETITNALPRITRRWRGADDQPSTDADKTFEAHPMPAASADVETRLLFQGQCLPHLVSLFSDALCLTGHPNVATDLVAETYRHASCTFQDCRPE